MRVVCGALPNILFHNTTSVPKDYLLFLNGDDMSENRFRVSIGLPLRGAYNLTFVPMLEDSNVVEKIMKAAEATDANLANLGERIERKGVRGLGNSMTLFHNNSQLRETLKKVVL
jgi:hypothetical protein